MIVNQSIAIHNLHMLKLLLVDEILLPRYMNLSTNFRGLPFNEDVAERISNHYLVRELFWQLEFRIYIFHPMRMTDAILLGLPSRAT